MTKQRKAVVKVSLSLINNNLDLLSDKFIAVALGVSMKTVESWRSHGVPHWSIWRFNDVDWPSNDVDQVCCKVKTVNENARGYHRKHRFKVLLRDGFKCVYCGATQETTTLHIDHVIPFSKGGKNSIDNLVTACAECNISKGDLMLSNETINHINSKKIKQ